MPGRLPDHIDFRSILEYLEHHIHNIIPLPLELQAEEDHNVGNAETHVPLKGDDLQSFICLVLNM